MNLSAPRKVLEFAAELDGLVSTAEILHKDIVQELGVYERGIQFLVRGMKERGDSQDQIDDYFEGKGREMLESHRKLEELALALDPDNWSEAGLRQIHLMSEKLKKMVR